MSRSPYLDEDKKAKLDYVLGLRLITIILYGILPATLAILDIKINIDIIPKHIFFILIIALIPVSILFLLIKNKLDKYYLMKDFSICRAIFITLIIFVVSIMIVGITRIVNGQYIVTSLSECEFQPFAESFILAIGSLMITSTLFWAFLTKDLELPYLPKKDFVNCIIDTRQFLSKISKNIIFKENKISRKDCEDIKAQVQTAKNNIENIQKVPLAFKVLEKLINDLDGLEKAIDTVKYGAPKSWNRYFSENNRDGIHQDYEKIFKGNMRIKKTLWR